MPIREIKGDITKTDCNIIAHGCNCFCVMGAGVAAALKRKWPEVYEADVRTMIGDKNKLGTFTYTFTKDGKLIFNLYTQYYYGRDRPHVSYLALQDALEGMRDFIEGQSSILPRIALPRIGCGLAGGEWGVVRGIIEEVFTKHVVTVHTL